MPGFDVKRDMRPRYEENRIQHAGDKCRNCRDQEETTYCSIAYQWRCRNDKGDVVEKGKADRGLSRKGRKKQEEISTEKQKEVVVKLDR